MSGRLKRHPKPGFIRNPEIVRPRRRMPGKEMLRKMRFYQGKIDKLWSKRLRIESVMYMSMIIEMLTRDAIIEFEKIIEGAAIEHHMYFNPRNLYSRDEIESQPLGLLVKLLDTYSSNKSLIEKLRRFSEMRNMCIHKLLSYEISDVNKKLDGFNVFFYEVMLDLMRLMVSQGEVVKRHFAHVCHDCFEKHTPKHVSL